TLPSSSHVQCHLGERFLDDAGLGEHAAKRILELLRYHPAQPFITTRLQLPTRPQLALCRPLDHTLRLIPGLIPITGARPSL
ncbi:MAG: hypothetical protein ACM36C_09145, partial [Acidobacteriota bacterium]